MAENLLESAGVTSLRANENAPGLVAGAPAVSSRLQGRTWDPLGGRVMTCSAEPVAALASLGLAAVVGGVSPTL